MSSMILLNKKIMSLSLAGSLVLGFLIFDFMPKINKIFTLRKEFSVRYQGVLSLSPEQKKKKKAQMEENLEQLKKDMEWSRQTLEALQGRIQGEENLPLFLFQIEQMVNTSKLEMMSLHPLEAVVAKGKDYKDIPFEVSLQGPFSQVMAFLESFAKEKNLITLREIDLQKDEALFPKLKCRMIFSVIHAVPKAGDDGQKPQ